MRYKGTKGKCWSLVAQIVKRKYKKCYTCPSEPEGRNAQAGHYRPVAVVGSNNKLAWDLDFIRLQCGHCNGAGQGQQVIFRRNLVKEHGEDKVKEYDRQVEGKFVNPVKNWDKLYENLQSNLD